MASKREAIVAAICAALAVASVSGTTKPSGLTVHRMRKLPIQADALPTMVVYLAGDEPVRDASSRSIRDLTFVVECRAEHPSSDGDTALDPLLVWAVKALTADITLGGACGDMAEGRTAWNLEEEAEALAGAAIEFTCTYITQTNDPETA